jgi:hypothetical protein
MRFGTVKDRELEEVFRQDRAREALKRILEREQEDGIQ